MAPQNDSQQRTHLRDYFWVAQKRVWTLIAVFMILVTTVTIKTFNTRPMYEANARLLIEKEELNVVSFKEVLAVNPTAEDYYLNQLEILKSRSLAKRVIDTLDLKNSPEFALPGNDGKSSIMASLVFWSKPSAPVNELPLRSPEDTESAVDVNNKLIDTFLGRLTVTLVKDTGVINVSFSGYYPETVAQIANAVVDQYLQQDLERRFSASQEALKWLDERLKEAKSALNESEMSLHRYKERESLITLENTTAIEEKHNIVLQKLAELNTAVTNAKTERIGLETLYNELQQLSTQPEMIESVPAVIQNRLIQDLKSRYIVLSGECSQLAERYGTKHPKLIRMETEMDAVKNKIAMEVKKIISSIETEYKVAKAREETLRDALELQKQEAMDLNRKAIQYGVLKREVETNKLMYNTLLTRMKETSLTGGLKTSNIRILDIAGVPRTPAKPNKKLNIMLAVIVGLTLGTGITFFLEYLDDTIRTPDDLESNLRLPFLGAIGTVEAGKKGEEGMVELFASNSPRSSMAECIRSIRTNIVFSSSNVPKKVLMISSAGPKEGKTIIAANLAVTMAQAGKNTLVVDGDMRRPRLNKLFGVERIPGLSNLLVEDNDLKLAIKCTNVPNLSILCCGHVPPNPSELLGTDAMEILCNKMRDMFDCVIFDSPPAMSVTDAIVLARLCDGVILIVKSGFTKRDPVLRTISQLSDAKSKILGAVLNNVDFGRDRYYYQYYYHYGYSGKEKRKHRVRKTGEHPESRDEEKNLTQAT